MGLIYIFKKETNPFCSSGGGESGYTLTLLIVTKRYLWRSVTPAVHHADIHLHAGLAWSDCFYLPSSLYIL